MTKPTVIVGAANYVMVGSAPYRCADCGGPVWLAPTGQNLARQLGLTIVCTVCAVPRLFDNPNGLIAPMTTEQAAEIRAHFQ